jgi:hypothetical protein
MEPFVTMKSASGGATIVCMSSREEFAGVPSIYWRVEATLVLSPDRVRHLAEDLSNLFGYETSS